MKNYLQIRRTSIYFQTLILSVLLTVIACSNKDNDPPMDIDNNPGLIDSLVARCDTIVAYTDTTSITVFTNVSGLKIEWSADHGTLLGEGNRIVYFSGQCCVGDNTITCRVVSDSQTSEKSVKIHVKSYFGER